MQAGSTHTSLPAAVAFVLMYSCIDCSLGRVSTVTVTWLTVNSMLSCSTDATQYRCWLLYIIIYETYSL